MSVIHRTILDNLMRARQQVVLEVNAQAHDGTEIVTGRLIELVPHQGNPELDELVLSMDPVVLCADRTIQWRSVHRILTPLWDRSAPDSRRRRQLHMSIVERVTNYNAVFDRDLEQL